MCLLCVKHYFKAIHTLTYLILTQLNEVGSVTLQVKKLRHKRGLVISPSHRVRVRLAKLGFELGQSGSSLC